METYSNFFNPCKSIEINFIPVKIDANATIEKYSKLTSSCENILTAYYKRLMNT